VVEVSGCVQSGPSPVLASGVLIIASGPALCSPLKGVGFCGLKPQATASAGSSNQKPTLKAAGRRERDRRIEAEALVEQDRAEGGAHAALVARFEVRLVRGETEVAHPVRVS
jgi:hypothetical protein